MNLREAIAELQKGKPGEFYALRDKDKGKNIRSVWMILIDAEGYLIDGYEGESVALCIDDLDATDWQVHPNTHINSEEIPY